jgi:hypothetical protein
VSQSLIFDAYTAYLALHRVVLVGWTVYDGPQPTFPTDQLMALVGCDDPLAGGMVTAVDNGDQQWEALGESSRLETFTIYSTLVVWSGDADFPGLRALAQSGVDALGAALRPPPHGVGDVTLGGVLATGGGTFPGLDSFPSMQQFLSAGGVGWCGLSVTRLQQVSSTEGTAVHVGTALSCTARV